MNRWAERNGIRYLHEINSNLLDEWRGQWSKEAVHKDDRMGSTSQCHFQTRLKGFFAWARVINLIEFDPALGLAYIKPSDKRTHVLTPAQFDELLAAVEHFTSAQTTETCDLTKELRASFFCNGGLASASWTA